MPIGNGIAFNINLYFFEVVVLGCFGLFCFIQV